MSWKNIKVSMQLYCESFFEAVERWRTYEDPNLLKNRMFLIEKITQCLKNDVQGEERRQFILKTDVENIKLLPQHFPTAGTEFIDGGDKIAFKESQKLVPDKIFQTIGFYFQDAILIALAGTSPELLATSNPHVRADLIQAYNKLLRLDPAAGFARLERVSMVDGVESRQVYTFDPTVTSQSIQRFVTALQVHGTNVAPAAQSLIKTEVVSPVAPISSTNTNSITTTTTTTSTPPPVESTSGLKGASNLLHMLTGKESVSRQIVESKTSGEANRTHEASVRSSSQPSTEIVGKPAFIAARSAGIVNDGDDDLVDIENGDRERNDPDEEEEDDEEEEVEDKVEWTKEHESIGMNVMALFKLKNKIKRKKFQGHVTRYLPESRPGAKDELYHIVWEDDDECDYGRQEFRDGRKLYTGTYPAGSSQGVSSKQKEKKSHVLIAQAPTQREMDDRSDDDN